MSKLVPPFPPSQFFPPVENASADGILLVGGAPFPETVLDALVHGIFPWPTFLGFEGNDDSDENKEDEEAPEDGDSLTNAWRRQREISNEACLRLIESVPPEIWSVSRNGMSPNNLPTMKEDGVDLTWWAPDPRAIYDLATVRVPKRLARTIKSGKFVVTFDEAFPEVMLGSALAKERAEEGSWITKEIYASYCQLHKLGFAHSVECWLREEYSRGVRRLVGGLYGVAINGLFDGESMFSIETDASKVAFFALVDRLIERGFKLFDLQVLNPHTERLGGIEIPREEYMRRLNVAITTPVRF